MEVSFVKKETSLTQCQIWEGVQRRSLNCCERRPQVLLFYDERANGPLEILRIPGPNLTDLPYLRGCKMHMLTQVVKSEKANIRESDRGSFQKFD